MARHMKIIQIHQILIIILHLVILKTKFLPLVTMMAVVQKTIKWNYLISVQIHGQRKLHFFSAHLSKSIFVCIRSHAFSISRYGVISRKSSVLIIGGYCDDRASSSISKYTIDKWERVGSLQIYRRGHRAMANEDRIYIVGGTGTTYVF